MSWNLLSCCPQQCSAQVPSNRFTSFTHNTSVGTGFNFQQPAPMSLCWLCPLSARTPSAIKESRKGLGIVIPFSSPDPRLTGAVQFSSVQSLSCVWLCNPWTAACQASLSITYSWTLLKLMSIKAVMSSKHLILCRPHLLLPSIFPSIRVFSSESVLPIRWPKIWSFRFSISPSSEYSGLISFRMDWLDHLGWITHP